MRSKVFMIGIDVELTETIVLELQIFSQCYAGSEWLKASKNFQKIIQNNLPERGFLCSADSKEQQFYFQKTSISPDLDILNIGIESMAYFKWLFYAFCQLHSELKPYVPQTHVLTLSSLDSIPIQQLRTTPLFKPIHLTLGQGVRLISPDELKDSEKLHQTLQHCQIKPPQPQFLAHFPFLMQQFLGFDKQITRVFALVIVDPDTGKIRIAIDQKNSYRSRLKNSQNNFETKNKEYVTQAVTDAEKERLRNFIQLFFRRLFITYGFTNFRYWQILARTYIDHHHSLIPSARLGVISQFCWAVVQQQRYTANKLSLYQCFVLEGFLRCYTERGDSRRFKSIEPSLVNALKLLFHFNIFKYRNEKNYHANEVLKAMTKACKLNSSEKEKILPWIKPKVHLGSLIEARPPKKIEQLAYNCLFSFLTPTEIDNVALVNKDHLNHVASYCRII